MKLSAWIISASVAAVSAYPTPFVRRDVDPSIVPEFGFQSGVNPTGTGDCDGAPGTNVKIPCDCPPDRTLFLKDLNENIAAGVAVNNTAVKFDFPTDNSIQSQISRINGVLVTLQNLRGPGVGCPAASTTLNAERAALQQQLASGQTVLPASPASTPTPSPAGAQAATSSAAKASSSPQPSPTPSPAAAAPATSGVATPAQVAALAPNLGFTAGQNPTGTGNCDGAIPGGPEVPCSCPPDQATFVAALQANVAAGEAIHNPTVKVTFPTDDSKASQQARITAASITIQNLKGPGVGCPIVSTTLQAQSKAIGN